MGYLDRLLRMYNWKRVAVVILGIVGVMALSSLLGPSENGAKSTADAVSCSVDIGDVVRIRSGAGGRVSVARTEAVFDKMSEAVAAKDRLGYRKLAQSGRVFRVTSGTRARVLDYGGALASKTEVRILAGSYRGEAGWIPSEWTKC